MKASTYQQIQELSRLTVGQLRDKHLDVFGEESRCHHKAALQKRIAWRLQALAGGGQRLAGPGGDGGQVAGRASQNSAADSSLAETM